MLEKDVIVRYDDRLISVNTLKTLIPAYIFFKFWDAFQRSSKRVMRFKMYKGVTITFIYR